MDLSDLFPDLIPRRQPTYQPPASPTIPLLPPQEEDSLLQKITGKTLGGLGYVGAALDKVFGGRAIRGVLGGHPEELASLIPFSDSLGITDESNRVSGEDLARKAGILEGEGQKGSFEMRDLVGPAIEMATDPGSYLSLFGSALSKGGQIAKKVVPAAAMPKNATARIGTKLADVLTTPQLMQDAQRAADVMGEHLPSLLDKPLGGHFGVGLPFAHPSFTVDASPVLDPLAKGANWLADTIPGVRKVQKFAGDIAEPIVRGLKAAFDTSAMEQTDAFGQSVIGPMAKSLQDRNRAKVMEELTPMLRTLGEEGINSGQDLRYAAERSVPLQSVHPNVAQAVPQWDALSKQWLDRLQSWGINVKELPFYFPRQTQEAALDVSKSGAKGSARFSTGLPPKIAREEIFNGLDSRQIEQLWANPAVRAAADVPTAGQAVRQQFPHLPAQQSDHLADWLRTLSPERKGLWNSPMEAAQNYGNWAAQAEGMAETAMTTLARSATDQATAGLGSRSLPTVLSKIGLAGENALPKQLDMLVQAGIIPQSVALGTNSPKRIKELLETFHVPQHVANALENAGSTFMLPEAIEPLVKVVRNVNNAVKAGLTSAWPGFNIRNLGSTVWQNHASGIPVKQLLQDYTDARTVMSQGEIKGAAKAFFGGSMTDKEATEQLANIYFQHGVGGGGGRVGDVAGMTHNPIAQQIPGLIKGNESLAGAFGKYAKGLVPTSLEEANLLNVRGLGGRMETKLAPVKAGEGLSNDIETLGRMAGLIGHLRLGSAPEVASAMVKAAHVDYANLTGFERQVVRELIPFYGWLKGNVPQQIKQITEQPSGSAAMAIKGTGAFEKQETFTPDYLSKGLIIPVGSEENGTKRFLTQLGLPFEDLTQLLNPRGLQATAMSAMSNLNPMLKGIGEYATGKQFQSGRDLDELSTKGLTGSSFIDQLLMNSPVSRVLTTGRTLLDDRKDLGTKALNIGTGLKLSDVDMEKARAVEGRKMVEEELKQSPAVRQFSRLYVRPEDVGQLSPAEYKLLQLNKNLEEKAKKITKEKKVGVRVGG